MTHVKKIVRFLLLILLSVSLSEGAYAADIFKKKKKKKKTVISLDSKSQAIYFNGLKNKIIGNTTDAIASFEKVLAQYPKHAATNYLMAQIENGNKHWEQAENYLHVALKSEPDNKWYKLLLGEIYRNQGKIREAVEAYEAVSGEFSGKPELYSELAMLYMYLEKPKKAIENFNKLEEEVGINEQIILEKQKLYQQMGEAEKGEEEIMRLVNSNPENVKYLNILANMYVENKSYDKAIQLYKRIEKEFPADKYLYFNMADLYRKINKPDSAFYALKKGFSSAAISLSTKVQILLNYYSVSEMYSDQKAQALSLAKILTETHPDESKSHAIYGDFLQKDNNLKEAKIHFEKAIQYKGKDFYLWQNYLNVLLSLGEYNDLVSHVTKAQDLFPMQPVFYLFGGLGYLQLKDYESAKKQLLQGEKLIIDGDELSEQFSTYLGEVYNELKAYDLSDQYFEKAIALNPNNAFTLNNYAYYLSLRGEKLEKAEEYARKAVRLDEDNENNQDTYGWVLYQMKRYEEAKYWIEKSIQNSEKPSAVVLEHLGDVYVKIGDAAKALECYKKAQLKGTPSKGLLKKIHDIEK
ncbi:MAG: hypothetical protein CSA94_00095 [Bacteroidetes bacterium]|nr:MAG: hypothetical protein CSA94_00095 [Bacteroidota bacterium]